MADRLVYLDNNSTTQTPKDVVDFALKWINKGNPSAGYKSAVNTKEMIDMAIAEVCKLCNIDQSKFHIIFNSGASESAAHIIRGVCDKYYFKTNTRPHIITTSIEHKCVLMCLDELERLSRVKVTKIPPDHRGEISAQSFADAIIPQTALICVMTANNETGCIIDYAAIGKIAHAKGIPVYVDAAQTFGKTPVMPDAENIDAFGMSFHKMHGFQGVGLLVIRKTLAEGYGLKALIYGSQFDELRGGTENVLGIASALAAMRYNFKNRTQKNHKLLEMKNTLMEGLGRILPCISLEKYWENKKLSRLNSLEIVFLSDIDPKKFLANTLLISVIKRMNPPICNSEIKKLMEERGVIISVGSACNTKSKYASHVMTALNADSLLKKGVLRISLGDENTHEDIVYFLVKFAEVLNLCISDKCQKKHE